MERWELDLIEESKTKLEEEESLQAKVRAFLHEEHENEFDNDYEYDEDGQYSEDRLTTTTCGRRTMSDDGRSESIWDEEDDDPRYSEYAASDMSELIWEFDEEEHGGWAYDEDPRYRDNDSERFGRKFSEDFATMFMRPRFSSSRTEILKNDFSYRSFEKSFTSFLASQFPVLCCLSNNSVFKQKNIASVSSPSTYSSSKTYDQHLQESSSSSTTSKSLPSKKERSAFKAWLAARSLLQYADSLESVGVRRVADLMYLSDEDLEALAIDYDDRVHFHIQVVG
mmetsp:Transcript_9626/g.13340  ORF Transcript_9626/g.13340 Transcript_9626/m.13340 type:complete len:282 (+) Transcript_9626:150-995(+)|eukprot:CAMPEP_0197319358 /NCGR_PEP_ID=MMETSP0891-20130614/54473_1 /TAXON_ID=44058 ORGANISM="Aureoumbra lagunensis, Strain CCMP1510" /NCGR_SAMPLE_ID=MMETSP0891 /ASSEMBLY_ACC=CAM_ASM_000534 /LENGTH=281 /DNA_ID=CAMNT_0042810249 /DNA_START=71 /DNA_END=916 /DNA_ORIENTATION=-